MILTPLAETGFTPALWQCLPFALLLLLIAVFPLTGERAKHFWEHNFHRISFGLAAVVALFWILAVPDGTAEVLHTAKDYLSFIALVGSLFVIAGGIHIKVKGEATPFANMVFLALGALLANVIGTTGASMVLIRPWIRMNKVRISRYHIVFFIFVVSNVGGSLTPVGDPPLFLGFLRGVPFFWLVDHVLVAWLFTVGLLLGVFFLWDRSAYRKIPGKVRAEIEAPDTWRFEGGVNVLLLLVVLGAVFLPPFPFLREVVMVGAAVLSYYVTPKNVHAENAFGFGPIREVAYLFVGIFMTMIPALKYLEFAGPGLGFTNPLAYYFSSGALSSVLDNAPTYVNFFELAHATSRAASPALYAGHEGVSAVAILLADKPLYIIAVSLGSVFFGAMTYIGNGPNFMVKSIADSSGVHTPDFVSYILKYSLPVLLPILALAGFLFLRS